VKRVAIIGNGGGGKTTLARTLANSLKIPVYHVDSIQFQPGWIRTPSAECKEQLNQILKKPEWIIDGFGGKDVIELRLKTADTIVFVDFPLAQHFCWAFKRQLASRHGQRKELPPNCPEFSIRHTLRLIKAMWVVNREYRRWFRTLLASFSQTKKVFHLTSTDDWRQFYNTYCIDPSD